MPKPRKRISPGEYEVGYCRPPKDTQFKKGEKQNHKRSLARKNDVGGYIQEELAAPVSFTDEDGRRRKMPKARVIAKQVVNYALKTGDPRRLQYYLPKPQMEPDEPFTEAELETIARFLEQFTRQSDDEEEGE